MNGLPADTDLSFLIAAPLGGVRIGRHGLILDLESPSDPRNNPGTSISIESAIRLVLPSQAEFTSDAPSLAGPALLPLLGSAVAQASVVAPGTLRLLWANGYLLDIIDSVEGYESYTVTHGQTVIVV